MILLNGCAPNESIFTYPEKGKYSTTKPFLLNSEKPEIIGGNFTKDERNNLVEKLNTQLDDSARVNKKNKLFIFHPVVNPPVFDTANTKKSARNMEGYLRHLGYYRAIVTDSADTTIFSSRQKRVNVKYKVVMGPATLIDTFSYRFKKLELQQLAIQTSNLSLIKQGRPVTKADITGEVARLVDLYRNSGYFKLTADDLRVRGDSTIAALTTVSDDAFENIRLLSEANEKRNKPTVKLVMVLNPASDSSKFFKYIIDSVLVYEDLKTSDSIGITSFQETNISNCIVRYHQQIVKNNFLLSSIFLNKGEIYRQENYNKTISGFSKTGVWQNVNIQITESKDTTGLSDSTKKINVTIQLIPSRKFGFEANIEASYSSSSNSNNVNVANSGNLLGLSGNVSLQNRNVLKQGIKWTHALRTGIELNLSARPSADNFINSSEVGYSSTISIPKLLYPFNEIKAFNKLYSKQTFLSLSASNTNRIGLFKLNSFGLSYGYEFNIKANQTLTIKPFNIEFSNLYNRTDAFDKTLSQNPYLRYSFNTALVMGSTIGYSVTSYNPSHPKRVFTFKGNFEESGALMYFFVPLDNVSLVNNYLKQFVKLDVEGTWTWTYHKSQFALRAFGGIGAPIGKRDTTLPFFKQYFAGGPNSMRGWPIRGIGPGSKPLAPFSGGTSLSDRTGDIRFETNMEYRMDVAQLIPNTLSLKWALFADIGNVWNLKNTNPNNSFDSAQFQLKNFYKQLGVNAGFGFRFDFNYVMIRFDLGFRFKRPELDQNAGWKAPSIGFNDLFKKIFTAGPNNEYRQWRYENFNFTIGLTYPF